MGWSSRRSICGARVAPRGGRRVRGWRVCVWDDHRVSAFWRLGFSSGIAAPRFAPEINIDRPRFASPGLHPASPQVCTWGYLLSPASRAERSLYVIVYPRFAPGATFLHPRCGFGKGRLCRKRCASLRIGMGNEMGLGVLEWKREMPMGGLRLRGSCDV